MTLHLSRHTAATTLRHVAVSGAATVQRRSSCIWSSTAYICIARSYDYFHDVSKRRMIDHTYSHCKRFLSISQSNEDDLGTICRDSGIYNLESVDITKDKQTTAQQSKENRRRLHKEKYMLAQQRRESTKRTRLTKEWMALFASSQDLFRATLKELNVDKREWVDGDEHTSYENDSYVADYKSFYLDSLNSFGRALAENDIESDISLESFRSVDTFAASSFNDPIFSKKFRSMSDRLRRNDELQATLSINTKHHSHAVENLQKEETNLHEMKGGQSTAARSESNHQDFEELGLIEWGMNATESNLFQTSQKKIRKQENKVGNARSLVTSLTKRIDVVQSEINGLQFPFSQEEYLYAKDELLLISSQLVPELAKYITNRHSDFEKYRQLEQHTDLTKPHEWYPRARLDQRRIIFHLGPTNSGKTYTALQRLKQANKGMYLAPLRLLAAETYESLTAEGVYCSLLTGQEQRDVPFSTHKASTVELADLEEDYDVCVIDEIQMISDSFRGYAWTRALMGVRCKEIHCCGGIEARQILEKITKLCGDTFEINTYKRFGELRVQEKSLAPSSTTRGSYSMVQPGDCIVAFTRPDIFAIKQEIEKSTSYKCCVIYGTLPPLIRAEQARLFNDPNSEYEILVASDAIGMGLNLSIKRIIFNSLFKNNGEKIVRLDHSLVKQIAGRAGRRNSPYPHGEVTCRDPNDMEYLRQCMSTEIEPIKKAGLIPTASHISLFDELLKEYGLQKNSSLHETLRKFDEISTVQGDFFICRKRALEIVSRWLKDIDNMSTSEKFTICMSPVKESCNRSKAVLMRYIEKHSNGKVPGIHREQRPREATNFRGLTELCSIYQELDLFLWLQKKLPSNAVEEARALKMKEDTIELINKALTDADKLNLEKYDYIYRDNNWRKEYNKHEV